MAYQSKMFDGKQKTVRSQKMGNLSKTKVDKLMVGWKNRIMTIQIRHSEKEVHTWRLQCVPRAYFTDMIRRPDPERRMNELLTIYGCRGE